MVYNADVTLQALADYTQIVDTYPDLAITEYARVDRALLLYQTGHQLEAILELEGQESSMRGYAEVHAALAAMLYNANKYTRAETQWDLANEFDKRYTDVAYITQTKHWPPAMVAALQRFLDLR